MEFTTMLIFGAVVSILGFIIWQVGLKKKYAKGEVKLIAQKPILKSLKRIGGQAIIEEAELINEDKLMVKLSNGMSFQIYRNELEPEDVFQCLLNKPIWRLKDEENKSSGETSGSQQFIRKLERKAEFESSRAKHLEANSDNYIRKAIENATKLIRSGKSEERNKGIKE